MRGTIEERFWAKVDKSGECWLWTGTVRGGYGAIWVEGRTMRAHRLAVEIADGKPIPVGLIACHVCDVKLCVRRSHLFVGTYSDNTLDAVRKGRVLCPFTGRRGSRAPRVTLTEAQVVKIRGRIGKESARVIALDYGVTAQAIYEIKWGQAWGWLA